MKKLETNQLLITTHGRSRHTAICGTVSIPEQPTEIELIEKLKAKGILLENFSHWQAYGTDYPFTWVWIPKS